MGLDIQGRMTVGIEWHSWACRKDTSGFYSLSSTRASYSEVEVRDYLWQILSATEYLHAHNILHLDLRSENMIITEPNLLKVLDFGNAQFYTQDKVITMDKCMDYVETMGEYRVQPQQPWLCMQCVVSRKTDRAIGQGSSWPQQAKYPRCCLPVTVWVCRNSQWWQPSHL